MNAKRPREPVRRVVDGHEIEIDPATSERMGRIRQRDTGAEMLVRRALTAQGLRYRTTNRDLPGSPDIANRSKRWAVFVHGCYWHRHEGCRRTTTPKRNREFWEAKFTANVARDQRAQDELARMGFRVLVVWECEAENPTGLHRAVEEFAALVA